MLSTKLVQLIEENWEEIASRLIVAIRKHSDMKNLARLPDVDLKEWCQQVLENLGHLLTATNEEEVERRYRIFGKLRFEENIPLHEAVLRFHILNDKVIGFIHEQGFTMNALELYAEEELEHRMGRYFDACVYHIVRGYEEALRRATRLAS